MKTQYLSNRNIYQRQLIALARRGERYVVACADDAQEPHYEGYRTFDVCRSRANQLQAETNFTHHVYKLERDSDGDVTCNYEDLI